MKQKIVKRGYTFCNYNVLTVIDKMWSSIEELTYNYEHPQAVRQLNLSSTSHFKIHQIEHLDNFVRLRCLILSNNMIAEMSGLQNLRNLRLLNLEFNQIKVLEGTQGLVNLEELYLSYNEIQIITQSILCNSKLRILHLAYNDIHSLDNMSVLYQSKQHQTRNSSQRQTNNEQNNIDNSPHGLSQLTTLSLYGNPIISNINYLSFFKMLIPSLRTIDDRDADDAIITNNVCPQQQVVILREAINKLLDERNAAVQELQHYVNVPTAKASHKKIKKDVRPFDHKLYENQQQTNKTSKIQSQLLQLLSSTKQKYESIVQNQKENVSKLTQMYSQNIRKNKQAKRNQSPIMQADREQGSPSGDDPQLLSKQVLSQLKHQQFILQQNQSKVKNTANIISKLQQAYKNSKDAGKTILQMVLFGVDSNHILNTNDYFKLCKKYLIKMQSMQQEDLAQINVGLIQLSQILKVIIYGQNKQNNKSKIQLTQIIQLKDRIKGKGLLQIITQLKQLHHQENAKFAKFQKQRKNFIKKFQKQTQQLSISWDELKQQKQKHSILKQKQQAELKQAFNKKQFEMKKKYRIAQQQQRQRIIQLKKTRQKSQLQLQKINTTLMQTQEELNRRFIELQQFQNHFNQFIQEKQHIKSLQAELNEITYSLQNENKKFETLQNKVKQLSLEQGIIENRLIKLEENVRQKGKQIGQLDKQKIELNRLIQKSKNQYDKQSQKLRQVLSTLSTKIQQVKDFDRMFQRSKKNVNLMEDKVRNIEQIQSNKKLLIRQLEQQIKCLKQDKQALTTQLQNLQKNLQTKRQELIKCQIKIQQNKLAMQTLTDLNKSIGDMMIRQSQLKRNIIELEIQNRNLLEMKNNMLDDFRMKHYV